ncbi:MAG: phosphatase PAP2 family protein, partial [Planctomycetes bacterium]|nr:phosphatase PAP2 family protein [Planctomycetota bacterium]
GGATHFAILVDPAVDPASYRTDVSVGCMPSDWTDGFATPTDYRLSRFGPKCQAAWCKVWTDHRNYYSWDVARDLGLALAGAAVLANTSLDKDFQDWYQEDVGNSDTRRLANDCKALGEGGCCLAVYLGLALVGSLFDEESAGGVVGKLGSRTTRAYLVGGPPVVLTQRVLGGSRPGESEDGSHWKPMDDANAVSGHAFMGAVPFMTAARMTDCVWLKTGLYACSALPAWSRIDQNSHYLSQACLGWWMAYLAASAVDETETGYEHLTFLPVTTPEMVGIGMVYER